MKGNMKRFMAIMLCMVQLFACMPSAHVHAEESGCAHAETTTVREYSEPVAYYGFTITEESHTVTLHNTEYTVCADCGEKTVSYGTVVGTKKVTEEHQFTDGICTVCDYVEGTCCHLNSTQTGGYQEQLGSVQLSETHHVRLFDVYWEYECGDCGETYSALIESGSETEEHVFVTDESGVTACNLCGFEKPACTDGHTLTDGVCSVCGYCQHTQGGSFVGTVTTKSPAEKVDDQFHKVVNTYNRKYQCSACGDVYVDIRELDLFYAHAYDDSGVCVCGAEGTTSACAHLEVLNRTEEKNIVYSNVTATNHLKDYDYYYYDQCVACDMDVYYEISHISRTENHTFTDGVCVCGHEAAVCETHTWNNGVCAACGAACLHESAYVTQRSSYYNCTDNGDGTHTGTKDIYNWLMCDVCNYSEEQDLVSSETATEDHYFLDGKCLMCGATSACAHEETSTSLTYYGLHYEQLDETGHYEVYKQASRTVCLNEACGAELAFEDTGVTVSLQCAHVFVDGVCSECGYAATGCTHANSASSGSAYELAYGVWTDNGDGTHSGMVVRVNTMACADCGASYKDTITLPYMRTAAHTRGADGLCPSCGIEVAPCETHSYVDGVCVVCGAAETACTEHSYEWTNYESVNGTPVYEDEQFHLLPYTVNNTYTCSVCGDSYVESTDYETHKAHEYDESGLCACGAQGVAETCEHPAENKEYRDSDINVSYKDITEEQHTKVADYRREVWCTACNTCRSWQEVETGKETVEAHTFENGVCACGYEQEACETHTWADGVCSVCGTICAHEDSTKGEHGTWENAVYSIIDTAFHYAEYDYAERYTCNICAKEYTVIVEEDRADLEAHIFSASSGVSKCVFCGACEAHTYESGVCSVCGVKEPCEIHIFVEGECVECGRVEACSHANASWSGRFKRDESFAVIDETTHIHTFGVWDKYTCPDCGDSYGVYLEDGFEVDDHAFIYDTSLTACNQCGLNKPCTEHSYGEDGVCTACGSCQHAWSSEGDFIGMEMLDPQSQDDDQFHIQPYLSYHSNQCSVCGETFVKVSEMEGEEAHTFDENGLCACGATGETTTCTHENIEWGEREYTFYSEETLTTHTVKTDVYWCSWCPDCETIRQRQLDTPGTAAAENHTYVGGVCSACGHDYLSGLKAVYELPADLTEIEAEAFIGSAAEAVIVPDGCVKIGAAAFADCAQLKVVVLPESVVNISSDSFSGCPDVVIFAANPSAAQAYCEANGYTWLAVEF